MAETTNKLDKKQKLALAGLTFFGILLVVIWFFKINSEIAGPLALNYSPSNSASTTIDQSTAALANEEKLKSQDTDGDGLSDWDEINIYHTSPYLADSDSDGIPDGVEVKNGTDPNCPQGKDCQAISIISSSTVPSIEQLAASSTTTGQGVSSTSQTDINLLTGQIDPSTLRNLLLQAGMDKKDLDQISDTDLMKNYQQMLASTTAAAKQSQ